jgi:hypothetical protein
MLPGPTSRHAIHDPAPVRSRQRFMCCAPAGDRFSVEGSSLFLTMLCVLSAPVASAITRTATPLVRRSSTFVYLDAVPRIAEGRPWMRREQRSPPPRKVKQDVYRYAVALPVDRALQGKRIGRYPVAPSERTGMASHLHV